MANNFKLSLPDFQVQENPSVSRKHDMLWPWGFRDHKSWIDILDVELYSDNNDPGIRRYGGIDLSDVEEIHYGLKGSDRESVGWAWVHLHCNG